MSESLPKTEGVDARAASDPPKGTASWGLPEAFDEPLVYLSKQQHTVLCKLRKPLPTAQRLGLPCWVPAREVAASLGYSLGGIKHALEATKGRPYLWATEFENVHSLWRYSEPKIEVDGRQYACSEAYYHSQKPNPFSDAVWGQKKEAVMEVAVRAKMAADPSLRSLLVATHPHPLVSIKGDQVWGFDAKHGGQNLLAQIWMRLRDEEVKGNGSPIPKASESCGVE